MKVRYYGFPILLVFELYAEHNFITRIVRHVGLQVILNLTQWSPTSLLIINTTVTIIEVSVRFTATWFVMEEILRLHLFLFAYTLTCVDILEKLVLQMISVTTWTSRLNHSNIIFYRTYEIIVRICNDCVCFVGYVYVVGSIGLCAFANYVLILKNGILPWFLLCTIILGLVVGLIGSQMALYFATQVSEKSNELRDSFKSLIVGSARRNVLIRKMKSLRKIDLTLGFHTVRFMHVNKTTKINFLSNIIENTANALLV